MRERAAGAKIKALVVEDSSVVRDLLMHILSSDAQINVIAAVSTGEEAIEAAQRLRPDVITMDVNMPGMNGLDATRRIMETCPTPIVIVSGSLMHDEVASTFRALEAGALAFVEKPNGVRHHSYFESAKQLQETVKLMAEVKVVRRWPKRAASSAAASHVPEEAASLRARPELVAIGSSTGGPIVLKSILAELRKDFPVPILMVQHIAPGFTSGFAEWLGQASGFAVEVAVHGQALMPGHAYVAPDGQHMQVAQGCRIALSNAEPEYGHRPAIAQLFRSVAAVCPHAVGVLLTGMGRDGAEELKIMKDRGAVTIAQDRESSVIHGMPGEAIRLDAATHILPPSRIVTALEGWFR